MQTAIRIGMRQEFDNADINEMYRLRARVFHGRLGWEIPTIAGMGIVALPGYVCRQEVQAGALQRVLPDWLAGDSTISALVPYRQGLLPSVRAFLDHIAAEFPKAVLPA